MANLSSETLQDRWRAANQCPSGFAYMRIVLAMLALVFNAVSIIYGEGFVSRVWNGPLHPFIAVVGPMFFALSGFLIAASLDRCRSVATFVCLRILRIVPALFVQVVLSAIFFGPIFTTLHLGMYFSDLRVYSYLLNAVGSLHLVLPGVFETNPFAGIVNMQLWVIPREVKCYVLIALLPMLGLLRPRRQTLLFLVLLHVGAAIYFLASNPQVHDAPNSFSGYLLLLCFFDGTGLYLFRHHLLANRTLFAASAGLALLLLCVPNGTWFASIPLSYATVYLGLFNPARSRIVLGGDYSYGVFLYAYPVQQAVVNLMPAHTSFLVALALALPCTLAFAAASWWLVEHPMQRLRPLAVHIGNDARAVQEALRLRCVDWLRRALSNE